MTFKDHDPDEVAEAFKKAVSKNMQWIVSQTISVDTVISEALEILEANKKETKMKLIGKDEYFNGVVNNIIDPTCEHLATVLCSMKTDGEEHNYYGRLIDKKPKQTELGELIVNTVMPLIEGLGYEISSTDAIKIVEEGVKKHKMALVPRIVTDEMVQAFFKDYTESDGDTLGSMGDCLQRFCDRLRGV